MMASAIMSPRRLKRKQVSKPSDKRESTYNSIMRNLKKIGFTRYDEMIDLLSSMNPNRDKQRAADEIVNTPGAANALEKIMLEDNDLDVAAATFTSLLYNRDDVELTEKQNVLFRLLLKKYDDLEYNLEKMGIRGGSVLLDILLTGTTNYSRFSAAHMMPYAEFSQETRQKIIEYMSDIPIENENEKLALQAKLFEICKGYLYPIK